MNIISNYYVHCVHAHRSRRVKKQDFLTELMHLEKEFRSGNTAFHFALSQANSITGCPTLQCIVL